MWPRGASFTRIEIRGKPMILFNQRKTCLKGIECDVRFSAKRCITCVASQAIFNLLDNFCRFVWKKNDGNFYHMAPIGNDHEIAEQTQHSIWNNWKTVENIHFNIIMGYCVHGKFSEIGVCHTLSLSHLDIIMSYKSMELDYNSYSRDEFISLADGVLNSRTLRISFLINTCVPSSFWMFISECDSASFLFCCPDRQRSALAQLSHQNANDVTSHAEYELNGVEYATYAVYVV